VVRVDRERVEIGGEIASVLFLQGVEAVQTVAVPLEKEGREEPGGPAVAIEIGMDGDELIVGQAGDEGRWELFLSGHSDPGDRARHQVGNVFGFGRQVHQGPRRGIPDRILAISIAAGAYPSFHQGMDALDQILGEPGPQRRPLLDPEQCFPVAADLAHVPLAPMEWDLAAGEDLFCLGQGQPVSLDPGGVVGGTEPRPVPELGRYGRR
jgi:hypothetical protein